MKTASQRKNQRKRGAALIGGEHGCAAFWALRRVAWMRNSLKTVRVWADIGNRPDKRLYRHYPDPTQEQQRVVHAARLEGYPDEHIIQQPFDGDMLLRYIEEWSLDFILIATFGGKIPKAAIDRLQGHVYVAHPCFPLLGNPRRLPKESRGARVMDRIVEQRTGQVTAQVALLAADEDWDTGEIVGSSPELPGPVFMEHEYQDMSACIRRAQTATAAGVGICVRNNLLRQLYQPERLLGVLSPLQFVKQGFPLEELRELGIKVEFRNARRKKQ